MLVAVDVRVDDLVRLEWRHEERHDSHVRNQKRPNREADCLLDRASPRVTKQLHQCGKAAR